MNRPTRKPSPRPGTRTTTGERGRRGATATGPSSRGDRTRGESPERRESAGTRQTSGGRAASGLSEPTGRKPAGRARDAQPSAGRPNPRSKPSNRSAGSSGETTQRRSRVSGIRSIDLLDPREPQRLSKIMAAKGLCSRREADYLIEKGWVRVDGKVVNELGTKVLPSAKIDLDAQAKANLSKQVTILYHKPIGVVSGQPEGRYKAAMEMLSAENQFDRKTSTAFSGAMLKGLAPAGRLDIDSTGLLVLTQDGRIARQLIDDSSTIEKEYLVRVEGEMINNGLELLRHGLRLDGQDLRPAKVTWLNEDQLKFTLIEGKKRQIRRMCELVGLRVTGLKRIRIGRIMLHDLPVGQWRLMRADEQF